MRGGGPRLDRPARGGDAALGDKARAKALAEANGVPVLPGYHGEAATDDDLAAQAAGIGYPLLVKASAGGGGRGMRAVREPAGSAEALAAARREAAASFGDDRLLLERYVERPRHVEVQVLGDAHGDARAPRRARVQRPAAAPEADRGVAVAGRAPAMRAAMGEAALRLARAAGYQNAGTVEFLLDEAGAFFFLEVNARLQVEHPVTEAVTGLDLVEQQLRVAAGEPLGFTQDDVRLEGHAMELRVVAEDAAAGFLPSTGVVTAFDLPDGVRVDTGVAAGSTCRRTTTRCWRRSSRTDATGRRRSRASWTRSTRPASRAWRPTSTCWVPSSPSRRSSPVTCTRASWTSTRSPPGWSRSPARRSPPRPRRGRSGRGRRRRRHRSRLRPTTRGGSPSRGGRGGSASPFAGRSAGRRGRRGRASCRGAGAASVAVDDAAMIATRTGGDPASGWAIAIGGETALVRPAVGPRRVETVTWRGRRHRLREAPPASDVRAAAAVDAPDALSAPMPGRVVRIHVAAGEHVREHEPLVILEAMKMEHVIAAASPGRVARVHVAVGDQVQRGQPLVDLEAAPPSTGEGG